MEGKDSTLYFDPSEEERFYRAITLVHRIVGSSRKKALMHVEHEGEHVKKIKDLGHEDKITGYRLRLQSYRCKTNVKASVDFNSEGVPGKDVFMVKTAPNTYSEEDFESGLRELIRRSN
jgi:hypothetical protein